jgi:hypothetical protein
MRYIVLDTNVAPEAIKGTLGDPQAARLTGMAWCVTFVAVGELWQWATTRSRHHGKQPDREAATSHGVSVRRLSGRLHELAA